MKRVTVLFSIEILLIFFLAAWFLFARYYNLNSTNEEDREVTQFFVALFFAYHSSFLLKYFLIRGNMVPKTKRIIFYFLFIPNFFPLILFLSLMPQSIIFYF